MSKHYKTFGIALLLFLLAAEILIFHPFFSKYRSKSAQYTEIVGYYALKYDLEPALIMAVIKTESNFDAKAISHADAYGLMQITEETLKWAIFREGKEEAFTTEDLLEPKVNIRYGCLILSLLIEEFEDIPTALAAYNAGRNNVGKWLKDSRYSADGKTIQSTPYKETNDYIEKVLKYQTKFQETSGGQP